MSNFRQELQQLLEKYDGQKGEPHVILGVFADNKGNLEGIVHKVHGPLVILKGLAQLLSEQLDEVNDDIDESKEELMSEHEPVHKKSVTTNDDVPDELKDQFIEVVEALQKGTGAIMHLPNDEKMKFLYESKIIKDELDDVKNQLDNAETQEERIVLIKKAEDLILKLAKLIRNIPKKDENDIDEILNNSKDFNKKSDIDDIMRKFGENLSNSDPSDDITDDDILS